MTVKDLIDLLSAVDEDLHIATTTCDGQHVEVSHINIEICVGAPGLEGEPVVTVE
jgi:hypothetical protein